uniref:Uncharacterized protein n=1 Tax=Manihot esculenta TaxID=3983 RepID=A0A2C9VMX0_MANES
MRQQSKKKTNKHRKDKSIPVHNKGKLNQPNTVQGRNWTINPTADRHLISVHPKLPKTGSNKSHDHQRYSDAKKGSTTGENGKKVAEETP